MQVQTVTTQDRSLLQHVRQTLAGADSALLCVAFVQERGVHLLAQEFERLKEREAPLRLLVTTTFSSTDHAALALAYRYGARVKVLNPGSGSTFHPKIYLGAASRSVQAVVGSANLTGGLATNVEAAVWMHGDGSEPALLRVREFGEHLWADPRAVPFEPDQASEAGGERIDAALLPSLIAIQREAPLVLTLGRSPKPNRVVEVTASEVLVETERSKARKSGAEPIPAWMLNLAWDYLRAHGRLTNKLLLDELRVHRSSAVCALLARLPGVARVPGKDIELRWLGAPPPPRRTRARP